MNISNEREISAITQTSRISSNEQGNWFKSLKSLVVAIFSVSLALWLIILVIAIIGIIPLTQLIVGSVHKNNCPMNHLIPIYLIVAGVIGLFILIISIIQVSFSFHVTEKTSSVNVHLNFFVLELFIRYQYLSLFTIDIWTF
jgi:hypothetical protein